jgi:hypothetical protein
MVKPAPVIAAEFTVTGEVPVEVSVNDRVVAVFSATLPKLRLAVLTESCGFGAAPVPFRATKAVPPVELLLIMIWPLPATAAVGSNWTWNVTDCVGFSVTGKLRATIVKPAPVIVAEFTVTGDVPVDVSVNDCVVGEFTATLPKFRLAALTDSCGLATAAPVPLSPTKAVPPVVELLVMVIWPLAAPTTVGSNWICSVTDCVGLNVVGKLPLTTVKPAPVIAAESTVTGDVPVEVSINACVVGEPTVTLPKLRLPVLTNNCGLAAAVLVPLNVTTVVPPVEELLLIVIAPLAGPAAVGSNWTCNVIVCAGFNIVGKLPPPTIVKPAPVIAAEFTVTGEVPVEVSVNDCVVGDFTVTLPKFSCPALNDNCGLVAAVLVPLKVTTGVAPVEELLLIVIAPLAGPTTVGSNWTCNVTDCDGFSVIGRATPPTKVKPVPVIAAEFTVTGDVPVDVNVTDCVVGEPTVTLPKLKLAVLTDNCGLTSAVLVPLKVTAAVPPVEESLLIVISPLAGPVAVGSNWTCSVTDCVGLSVTGKLLPMIVKPAPVIAAEFTVTGEVPVEVSVSDCVVGEFTVTLPKFSRATLTDNCGLAAAVLVPLKVTAVVPPVEELLLIVISPLAGPVAVGSNWTCSVTDCVGLSVNGKLLPMIVKPAPVIAAEFTVTGEVPDEVSVSDCVVGEFTVTLPKFSRATLTDNCGLGAAVLVPLKVTTVVALLDELLLIVISPLAGPVAVGSYWTCNVTACVGFNVVGKLPPTIVKPAPVITAEFTVTAAVPVEVSVNDWVVGESTVTLPKLRLAALTDNSGSDDGVVGGGGFDGGVVGGGVPAGIPVPLRATTAVLALDELLLMVICPLPAPADVGSYCTCNVIDWDGLSVTGKPLPPTRLNPAPVIDAEFTVTGDVPVDVSVSDCVVAVVTVTLPKFKLEALTVNCAALCDADPCPCIGTWATVSPCTPVSVTCPE